MFMMLERVGLALACLLFAGECGWCAAEDAPRPNVLFLVIDDLNDWVGVLGGHPQAHTPNIDRLAARGMLFTNAHCPAPICVPSRTAVMTGVYPHVSGITGNRGTLRKALPDAITIPELFRKAGYSAHGTGKVFHYPQPEAWDGYYPSLDQPELMREQLAPRAAHGNMELRRKTNLDWAALDVPDARLRDSAYGAWVRKRLRMKSESPFFLACGFSSPHLPWFVPEKYYELFPLEGLELPLTIPGDRDDLAALARKHAGPGDHELVLKAGLWGRAVQAYLASVAFVDNQVGLLLDALEAGPNAEDTLVVLWSDHGMSLGEKQHWLKRSLWEEATRVPLIIAGPGVKAGRCERAVGIIDLYRTLAEVAGIEPRAIVGGYSLAPLLSDPSAERPAPVLIAHGRGSYAVRSDRWRYIRYAHGGEELYDHDLDPHEWTNLAEREEHAGVKERLAAWIPE